MGIFKFLHSATYWFGCGNVLCFPSDMNIITHACSSDPIVFNSLSARDSPAPKDVIPPALILWICVFAYSKSPVKCTFTLAELENETTATLSTDISESTTAIAEFLAAIILDPPILPDLSSIRIRSIGTKANPEWNVLVCVLIIASLAHQSHPSLCHKTKVNSSSTWKPSGITVNQIVSDSPGSNFTVFVLSKSHLSNSNVPQ